MEDDRATGDDDGIAGMMSSLTTSTTAASNNGVWANSATPSSAPPVNPRNKTLSYSQPLGRGTPHRKNQTRNHSLGEDEYHFNSLSADSTDGDNSNHPKFYHHSSSLPEDALRQHHSLPPPHLQHVQVGPGAGPFFPLERISSSPASVGGTDESQPTVDPPTSATLPEFIGKGGGAGIFKVPVRGAVHPGRPPSIELRPHPLRETQVGTFLRTIACESSQLWAGLETGVRFWDLDRIFQGRDDNEKGPKGDEETAPFQESCRTSPVLCLALDSANRLVWSGHKDGKIKSWRMDQPQQQELSSASQESGGSTAVISHSNVKPGRAAAAAASADASTIKEGLSWQAHRGPILSIVFTSLGDLWSSSEGGIIKVWPWEAIEKSLSLSMEERHMAALLVERSFVDLRSQVTVNGICPLPSADIRFLLSDISKAKVWSGSSQSFALWNVRTKELLKVFNIDGQTEIRVDMPSSHDPYVEDEMKVKFVSSSKKDKSQGSVSFFQRSRNALIGAADAVRRVATKGAFGEDNRKTEAMVISMDGMIWMGCANGSLIQWDANANRIQEFQHHSSSVQSLYAFGTRLWVGYVSGNIQILDLEGNLLGGWVAHSSPVIKMSVGGNYLFTLANSGGIRGWNLTSPGFLDDILRTELTSRESLYTKLENFKILIGTWNVGQERASHDALTSWVGSAAPEADLVIVGFQEVEMGAGFLAMAAAKETVGLEGSANGHWWLDAIGKTLDEGSTFERVGSRQLAGLLIGVWARKSLRKHIGDIDAAAVACGFGRAIGNKGGVGLRMRIYGRVICCVNCHLAAHLEAVNKRNADFDHIYRTMSFSRPSGGPNSAGGMIGGTTAIQVHRGPNPSGLHSDDGTPDLCEADMIIFLGDFNYRLHGISYDEARDFVSQRSFDWLREKDQLRAEMEAGKVFQGMREGLIRFPPTYKFERHKPGLSGYDSGEKKRIPAWCDRILFRDTRSISLQECSLECPLVTSILQYNACMDVTDSDHKPVRCLLNVDVARVDKLVRRQEFGDIILSNERIQFFLEEVCNVPEIIISTNSIMLQNSDTSNFYITNKSDKDKAVVEITCEGQSSVDEDGAVSEYHPRGASGFPCWLEVTPTVGVIKPGQNFEVSVHHEESHTLEDFVDGIPQNWWSEDTRDKEVILAVKVTGNFSAVSKTHKICVRHCFSSKNASSEQKGNSGRKLFRDFFSFTNSTEDSCNLHTA